MTRPFMSDQGFIRKDLFGGGDRRGVGVRGQLYIAQRFITEDISGFSCSWRSYKHIAT